MMNDKEGNAFIKYIDLYHYRFNFFMIDNKELLLLCYKSMGLFLIGSSLMNMNMNIYVYIYVHVICIYMYMYIYKYVYTYTYIHLHLNT
jgi:hypothetical protein